MVFTISALRAHTKAFPKVSPENPEVLPEGCQDGCPGTFQRNPPDFFSKSSFMSFIMNF